ncbi:MAG: hypothetical protein GF372_12960 [Candidatus Marinimicrobia bacterium]|nr:hypothetical protein [Candidatus Neomarinimicrobiota bacterium]
MVKIFISVILLFMMFSCEHEVTDPFSDGSITGRILYHAEVVESEQIMENIKITIPGTSIHAYTDSAGEYSMFDVPAGNYSIQAQTDAAGRTQTIGVIKDVLVTGGEITTAPDIVCEADTSQTAVDFYGYFGGIQGKLVIDNKAPEWIFDFNDISVFIQGTSLYAVPDSNGNFMILNLPAGVYDLQINEILTSQYGLWTEVLKSVKNTTVKAGEMTDVGDIHFVYPGYTDEEFYITLLDTSNGGTYRLNDSESVLVHSENMFIRGELPHYRTFGDTLFSVSVDDEVTVVSTQKSFFYYPLTLNAGLTSLEIWMGDIPRPAEDYVHSEIYFNKHNTDTDIVLRWSSGDSQIPAGDFDLYLINTTIQDTCWYNNPNPDWGLEDVFWDDPRLNWDNTNQDLNSYALEQISLDNPAEGTYKIKVQYFDNPVDPAAEITPEIELHIGDESYRYISPQSMTRGDLWEVLEIVVDFNGAYTINEMNIFSSLPKTQVALQKDSRHHSTK